MAVQFADDASFINELGSQPIVIVKYYADWCGSCKLFSPRFKRLSEDARFAGISFLEVNSELNPQARRMAGVNNLPFFATFRNGELIERLVTTKEEEVVRLLEKF